MLHNDLKQYMFGFRNQTVYGKIIRNTTRLNFYYITYVKKDIYLQVGQIVKNGFNTLKSKMYEFLFSFNSIEHK